MANKVGLTDAKIAGLKAPAAGQIELAGGIVPGLRLRMGASGIKTYILRKRIQGKWLNVTIGLHSPNFTLCQRATEGTRSPRRFRARQKHSKKGGSKEKGDQRRREGC